MEAETVGPLSANSFMMALRARGASMTRETAPDTQGLVPPTHDMTSDSSSVTSQEDRNQFTFSEPTNAALVGFKGQFIFSL